MSVSERHYRVQFQLRKANPVPLASKHTVFIQVITRRKVERLQPHLKGGDMTQIEARVGHRQRIKWLVFFSADQA
jgi:hypothetical protein